MEEGDVGGEFRLYLEAVDSMLTNFELLYYPFASI